MIRSVCIHVSFILFQPTDVCLSILWLWTSLVTWPVEYEPRDTRCHLRLDLYRLWHHLLLVLTWKCCTGWTLSREKCQERPHADLPPRSLPVWEFSRGTEPTEWLCMGFFRLEYIIWSRWSDGYLILERSRNWELLCLWGWIYLRSSKLKAGGFLESHWSSVHVGSLKTLVLTSPRESSSQTIDELARDSKAKKAQCKTSLFPCPFIWAAMRMCHPHL